MSNVVNHNPWVIDTASATLITSDPVRIARVRWVGATTAGHGAILQDAAGHVVYEGVATGANYVDDKALDIRIIYGLACTTLGSGKLYLEFE